MTYDLLIVGGGAAGLYLGIEWLKQNKGTCCILEASTQLGGRVATYHKGKLHWEEGAGRIALSHRRVLSLLKRYHLHTSPISPHTTPFYDLYNALIEPLSQLPKHILSRNTLSQLLFRVHGPSIRHIVQQFPYWSEIHLQRADVSLQAFEGSMGNAEKFVVCQEGLSNMIDGMAKEFTELGGVIRLSTKVTQVREGSVSLGKERVDGKKIVLALAHGALSQLYHRSHIKDSLLRHIAMAPLIRMYAVFNKNISIPRMVLDSRIRYVIPISSKVVMISYTDGGDAMYWARRIQQEGEKAIIHSVMKELQTYCGPLPDPIDFAIHHWSEGCSYWLPGDYSVSEVSDRLLHSPLRSVYVCGESYAEEPCWIESALIQAEKLLRLL